MLGKRRKKVSRKRKKGVESFEVFLGLVPKSKRHKQGKTALPVNKLKRQNEKGKRKYDGTVTGTELKLQKDEGRENVKKGVPSGWYVLMERKTLKDPK